MLGMNRAAVERFTKMMQWQAEKPVGELVAGGSFTGMESEKAWPHQSALDVWSYFPFFFFLRISEAESTDPQTVQTQKASICVLPGILCNLHQY